MSQLDCLKINRQGNAFFNNTHRQGKNVSSNEAVRMTQRALERGYLKMTI